MQNSQEVITQETVSTTPRFNLKSSELLSWLQNALIFLAPAILAFLMSLNNILPQDWKYAFIAALVINEVVALFKQWVQSHQRVVQK
jgi:hypothetical protein